MIPNGPTWSKMITNGTKWSQMVLNGLKWSQMVQMILNYIKWPLIVLVLCIQTQYKEPIVNKRLLFMHCYIVLLLIYRPFVAQIEGIRNFWKTGKVDPLFVKGRKLYVIVNGTKSNETKIISGVPHD